MLNLDDGTRVELNTDTQLLVKYDHHTRTVVLKSGEAYFQVAHEHRPFMVFAGERKILALGTAFTVRRDGSSDEALTVTLIEGRVVVAPVNADPGLVPAPSPTVTLLNAGQRLRTRAHAKPTVDTPSIEKATGWMRGQLIFDHTPLREAAAEFSRYNKIKITVASPEAAEIPIGGIFRIGDSRSFARAVAASYDLQVTVNGDELVLEPMQDSSPSQRGAFSNQ
jgi:transmembrane sensor